MGEAGGGHRRPGSGGRREMADRVLVAYATKHGSTAEMAERIGAVLRAAGLETDVLPADEVEDLSGYGAVVLGSGVYYGRWLKPAVRFLKRWRAELEKVPLWVFSSGPTGEGEPYELTSGWRYPRSLQGLLESLRPLDVTLFKGKIDSQGLGSLERKVINKVKAPAGDFREWEGIEAWASAIAARLISSS